MKKKITSLSRYWEMMLGETTNLVSQNPRLARKLAKKVCDWYEANRR